jgi:ubiquinone/menaquinone biosynthesis C-methylase UbiE
MSTSTATPDRVGALLERLESGRYKSTHRAMAVVTGLLARPFHKVMHPRGANPSLTQLLALNARLEALFEQDLHNSRAGFYPREVLFDMPLGDYARHLPAIAAQLPRMAWRKHRKQFDDLPTGINPSLYPDYYLRTFHWQTDGWLSARSAQLYDVGVELLFGGTGDVMRRMAIPPLVTALRNTSHRPHILDVGCGTGRFLAALHRSLPNAKLYGVDLSAPYLATAQALLRGVPDLGLLCERGESLPFAPATFDAVTSVFLFHELPRDVRRDVAREAWRVLKPGGLLVLCDAAQLVDSPQLEFFLDNFQSIYHEPFFKSHIQDDLAGILLEAGFSDVTSQSHFVCRVVVGHKPSGAPGEM